MKKIYFSGGGFNGISYIGVIKKLEEKNKLKDIISFHGVSIGSLIAGLLCLGYSYKELEEIILSKNLKELRDIKLNLFLSKMCLDTGEKLEKWIQELIEKKGFNKNITFFQLKNIKNKKLITYSTEITLQEIFRCDYKLTPDLPIFLGIRMSMSIPYIYKHIEYSSKIFVDGAVISNFPFISFEKNIKESIGFYIFIENKKNDTLDILNYSEYILRCIAFKDITKLFLKNIHIIYIKKDQFINFNLKESEIKELIEIGYNSF